MSKPLQVRLTAEDRQELESLVRGGRHPARVIKRAQLLLMSDVNGPKPRKQGEIVEALGTRVTTVSATGRRYAQQGLPAALGEKPRRGREPKSTGEVEAHLVLLACSDPPEGQVRGTLRLLAEELVRLEHVDSISHTAVDNALKKTK